MDELFIEGPFVYSSIFAPQNVTLPYKICNVKDMLTKRFSVCRNVSFWPLWKHLRMQCICCSGDWPVGSCLKTGQHSIFVIIRKIKQLIHVCWIPQIDDLYSLWSNIFIIRIIIIIIGNKKIKQYL